MWYNLIMIDLDRELHKALGKVELAGKDFSVSYILSELDEDYYEEVKTQHAIGMGYYLDPDTDTWFESYEDYCQEMHIEREPLDFSGCGDGDR